jgi:hypothetical protein
MYVRQHPTQQRCAWLIIQLYAHAVVLRCSTSCTGVIVPSGKGKTLGVVSVVNRHDTEL